MKYQPKTKEELKALCKDESVNLGDIDTSLITDMSYLLGSSIPGPGVCVAVYYSERKDYSGIESWNTSRVTNMHDMFFGAKSFNQDIRNWNVSNVQFMSFMFEDAESFKQKLPDTWAKKAGYTNPAEKKNKSRSISR